MDHRITQCPRCGTSFRVTEAHLAVAAGAVRCGSCLHIFNAREHWIEPAPTPAPETEKPIAAKKIEEIEIDDDALFDDDTPVFGDDEPEPTKTKSGSIFNPIDDDFEVIDDSDGEAKTEEFSESFLDINSWEEDSGHSFSRDNHSDIAEPEDESKELAWTQKLLEEEDEKVAAAVNTPGRSSVFDDFDGLLDAVPEIDETEQSPFARGDASSHEISLDQNNPSTHDNTAEFSDEFLNLDTDAYDSRERTTIDVAKTDDNEVLPMAESSSAGQPLFALREFEPEPIRLHQFVHESRWPRILWRVAFVAALALSAGQYIYFNFDELARGSLRPQLAQACAMLGCVLPPQSDIDQIRTNSLIVRSHPTQRGALAVDAIITNQADFPQPYPVLQLQFSDLNGVPVAGRRFQPSEYLSGELAGVHLMPVRQPVHIALELVDPGTRAVNYQLTVVPAAE